MERLKAVFYARVSTEEEAQLNAIELQIEENRSVIKELGWELVDEYIDRGKTGTKVDGREEYQRLLEDIRTDKFDIIVAKDQDRLQRNSTDWGNFKTLLVVNSKKLYLYLDGKFFKPSEDALITGVKAIIAEEFSRNLSKKLHNFNDRRMEKAKAGDTSILLQGITNSYGWTKREGEIVLEPEEAKVRRLMCELTLQGKGSTEVAKIINDLGHRNSRGNLWRAVDVARLVYDTKNVGTCILGQKRQDFEKGKMIHTEPSEWIYLENAIPPIVSKEEWDKLQKIRAERTTGGCKPRGKKAGGSPIFSGKLVCGCCGATYWRKVNCRTKEEYWVCSTKQSKGRQTRAQDTVGGKKGEYNARGCDNHNISTKALMEIIQSASLVLQEDREELKESATEYLVNLRKKLVSKSTTYSEADLKKEEAKLERLLDSHLEGLVTKELYAKKARAIEDKIAEIQADLKSNDSQIEDVKEIDRLLADMDKTIAEYLEENKDHDGNYILAGMERILVYPDGVKIQLPQIGQYFVVQRIEKSQYVPTRKPFKVQTEIKVNAGSYKYLGRKLDIKLSM